MSEVRRTVTPGYGRCGGCDQIKHVAPDGIVQVHNSYSADGTALVIVLCPGSGAPPVDLASGELDA
jgi:hypothetical protein